MTWTWRQTRDLISRRGGSGQPAPLPPSAATPDGRPTRPDRLSIWPTEDDTFGIDVLYVGDQGRRRAEQITRQLSGLGQPVKVIEEGQGAVTVRVGPVSREDMLTVVNGYIW
jgi:hypothetical protein